MDWYQRAPPKQHCAPLLRGSRPETVRGHFTQVVQPSARTAWGSTIGVSKSDAENNVIHNLLGHIKQVLFPVRGGNHILSLHCGWRQSGRNIPTLERSRR